MEIPQAEGKQNQIKKSLNLGVNIEDNFYSKREKELICIVRFVAYIKIKLWTKAKSGMQISNLKLKL